MSHVEVIKQILARDGDVPDGMAAMLSACRERYPHPAWDLMGALDYQATAEDFRAWLLGRAVPDVVEVIWLAMWDVTTGFDLRGSTSWSRDPEDWEWWFHDDFHAGRYQPAILGQMHEVARQAGDPNAGPTPAGGVLQLTDILPDARVRELGRGTGIAEPRRSLGHPPPPGGVGCQRPS